MQPSRHSATNVTCLLAALLRRPLSRLGPELPRHSQKSPITVKLLPSILDMTIPLTTAVRVVVGILGPEIRPETDDSVNLVAGRMTVEDVSPDIGKHEELGGEMTRETFGRRTCLEYHGCVRTTKAA